LVVRGVSADLPAGRLVRVAGRNGSGKSTLLRVVAGVSLPSADTALMERAASRRTPRLGEPGSEHCLPSI
jgi:iron complex transport system ATP-binding protein